MINAREGLRSIGCLAIKTTPNPTGCRFTQFIEFAGSRIEEPLWYNLASDTVYYWRVGTIYDNDYDHPKWSLERAFTSGAAGGTILPAPVLESPADNSIVSTEIVTLTWKSLPGAVEYSVSLHGTDTGRRAGFGATSDTQRVIKISDYAELLGYGYNFEWTVEARNDFAWGEDSAPWKFSYSPNPAPSR